MNSNTVKRVLEAGREVIVQDGDRTYHTQLIDELCLIDITKARTGETEKRKVMR